MQQPVIAKREVTQYILKRFGISTNKKLGQNFLIDAGVVTSIAQAAELGPEDEVLEIGPGIGTLTQGLLETGAKVTAVELDNRLLPVLSHTLEGYDNFKLVHGDILKTDIKSLFSGSFKVVANLPYYITTPIIMALFEQHLPVTKIVTMVQKEVAERMAAEPGSKAYGALSVAVQYYSKPTICFDVSPRSFIPMPEVESSVIACDVYDELPFLPKDEKLFFKLVKAAFGQRRKTLLNSLCGGGFSKELIKTVLQDNGIEATRRGETLSIAEYVTIADAISMQGGGR